MKKISQSPEVTAWSHHYGKSSKELAKSWEDFLNLMRKGKK
jgi:hypothetical protein